LHLDGLDQSLRGVEFTKRDERFDLVAVEREDARLADPDLVEQLG
jgi:hypothetical protein